MKLTKKQTLPILLAAAITAGSLLPLALAQNPPAGAGAPAAPAAPAAAPKRVAPDAVVLQIGDEKLTAAQFNNFLAGLPAQYQQNAEEDLGFRRQLADGLVRVRLLAREARKRGLDKSDKSQMLLALAQDQVLSQAVADELVSDDVIRSQFNDKGYVTARHILISTKANGPDAKPLSEDEAKKKADAVRARLVKGEDFAAVAKIESDDPGSKDTGGVYTFKRDQMVKEFEDTAFGLKEGELSQPIKTKFGYHLIQRMAPDVKQVRPQIEREVAPKKMDDLLSDLKKQTPVTLNPDFFGAPPAPAPAAPGAPTGAPGAAPAPTGDKK